MKKFLFSLVMLILIASPFLVMAGDVTLDNPLGKDVTPQVLIGRVINAVLGVVGSLALLMFIWGGLVWMTAAGNEQKITTGRNILLWAAIGLIVVFSSYTLVRFILQRGLGV